MKRLESLDALRGFDMLLIIGLAYLVCLVCALWPESAFMTGLGEQMRHVSWDGLHFYDTVFPLFLFIAGVTFPFSLAKSREKGIATRKILLKVLRRALILVGLGIIYNGFFELKWATFRIPSVLGRIGVAWAVAAILQIYLSRNVRMGIAGGILVGYALLSALVGAPDAPAGASPLSLEGCLAGWLDRTLLGQHIYHVGQYDPEGILGTVPAIATAMLGMFSGELLLSGKVSAGRKVLYLAVGGLALAVVGGLWSIIIPFNKMLWSSSFVCAVGAYSTLMLALFYWLIDVKGWKKWAFPLKVIGVNSITIYLLHHIVRFRDVSKFFLGGLASYCSKDVAAVIILAGAIVLEWLVLYLLYKKKIFVKI